MENIGGRIKRLRIQAKLTQTELAEMMRARYDVDTDRTMISRWETGRRDPGVMSMKALSNIFGVTLDEMSGADTTSTKQEITPKEVEMLRRFRLANDQLQDSVLDVLLAALKMHQ